MHIRLFIGPGLVFFAIFVVPSLFCPAELDARPSAGDSTSFFPLSIGNTWVTQVYITQDPFLKVHTVLDTVRLQGHLYYHLDFWGTRYFREDSLGRFYEFRDSTEFVLMDFNMQPGDSLKLASREMGYTILKSREAVETLAGTEGEELFYVFDYNIRFIDEEQMITLQEGIGPVVFYVSFDTPEYLQGAVIDGKVYGDTSVTSVGSPTEAQPRSFFLHQNHPNPFNPGTRIRYELSEVMHVRLVILNVLGQEVVTLVDGKKAPGEYAVGWDGRDARGRVVASGVYLYQLRAAEEVQTRWMLKVK